MHMNLYGENVDRVKAKEKSIARGDKASEAVALPSVRIAVYAAVGEVPKIIDITRDSYAELTGAATEAVCSEAKIHGSFFPETIVVELISNLVHSGFKSSSVSIDVGGRTLAVSDLGKGIEEVEKACRLGFSTANEHLRRFIRGVGSGLSIVKSTVDRLGGSLSIEKNLDGTGTVITVWLPEHVAQSRSVPTDPALAKLLSERQKKILLVLLENGGAGPSLIAKELGVSISTVHRDLVVLEKAKVIESENRGSRCLSQLGLGVIESFLNENI